MVHHFNFVSSNSFPQRIHDTRGTIGVQWLYRNLPLCPSYHVSSVESSICPVQMSFWITLRSHKHLTQELHMHRCIDHECHIHFQEHKLKIIKKLKSTDRYDKTLKQVLSSDLTLQKLIFYLGN